MKNFIQKMFNIGIIYAIPIAIIFIIVLLAYWPGIFVGDGVYQWHQLQTGEYTTWHPIYSTLYMKTLSIIWNNPAFLILFQCLFMAFVMGYFMSRLNKYYNINRKYLIVASILFAIVPINYNYAVTLLKDYMYSACILLLSAVILDIINDKEYFKRYKNIIALLLILLCISLFRHNGIAVVILFLGTILLMRIKEKQVYILIVIWAMVYIFLNSIVWYLVDVEKADYANKYGPISHVMARILNDKNANFTEENRKELEKYVDTKKLKNIFHPYNMDNSIISQRIDYIKEHELDYVKFGIKIFVKNIPIVIEHYIHLTSFLYSPIPFEGSYAVGMFIETELWIYEDEHIELLENAKIPYLGEYLKKATVKFQSGEIGALLIRPAGYMYISIISIIIICLVEKNKKIWLILLPSIFNTLSMALFIPVAMTRYIYSTLLVFWITTTWIVYIIIKKLKEKINKK